MEEKECRPVLKAKNPISLCAHVLIIAVIALAGLFLAVAACAAAYNSMFSGYYCVLGRGNAVLAGKAYDDGNGCVWGQDTEEKTYDGKTYDGRLWKEKDVSAISDGENPEDLKDGAAVMYDSLGVLYAAGSSAEKYLNADGTADMKKVISGSALVIPSNYTDEYGSIVRLYQDALGASGAAKVCAVTETYGAVIRWQFACYDNAGQLEYTVKSLADQGKNASVMIAGPASSLEKYAAASGGKLKTAVPDIKEKIFYTVKDGDYAEEYSKVYGLKKAEGDVLSEAKKAYAASDTIKSRGFTEWTPGDADIREVEENRGFTFVVLLLMAFPLVFGFMVFLEHLRS